MSDFRVENEFQYQALLSRIDALEQHLDAIARIGELARRQRAQFMIEDEDLRDLAPLDDARTDVACTRDRLRRATGDWEDLHAYGRRRGARAPAARR